MSESTNSSIRTIVEVNSDETFFNEDVVITADSLSEVDEVIKGHEESTQTKYILFRKIKQFGTTSIPKKVNTNVFWNSKKGACVYIPFKGTPYLCLGQKLLECHMGRDKDKSAKEKYNLTKNELLAKNEYDKVPRNRPTKKIGCTAKIYVAQLVRFPTVEIENNSLNLKKDGVRELMGSYNEHRKKAHMEFVVYLPNLDQHLCKTNEQGIELTKKSQEQLEMRQKREDIDDRILNVVIKSALSGYDKGEIEKRVNVFVEGHIFKGRNPPPACRRKFYPRKKDYSSIIHEVKLKLACMRAHKMERQERFDEESEQSEDEGNESSEFPLFSLLVDPVYKDKVSEDEVVQEVKQTWLIASKPKFRKDGPILGKKTIELVMDMEEQEVDYQPGEEVEKKEVIEKVDEQTSNAQKRSHTSTDRNGLLTEVTKKIKMLSDMAENLQDDDALTTIDKQLNQLVSVVVKRKPNIALIHQQNQNKD